MRPPVERKFSMRPSVENVCTGLWSRRYSQMGMQAYISSDFSILRRTWRACRFARNLSAGVLTLL